MSDKTEYQEDASLEGEVDLGSKWGNAPDVNDLKADLTAATPTHTSQESKVRKWLDALHVSSDQPAGSKRPGRSSIQPKIVRRNNEWRYTSFSEPFLDTPDIFKIHPVTAGDIQAAKQNELVLNNQFNTKINKVNFIDRYVRKGVDEGTAIIRVGWSYKTTMQTQVYPRYVVEPTNDPRHIAELQKIMQSEDPKMASPEKVAAIGMWHETGVPHYPVQEGFDEVENEVTVANHPTLRVCDLEDVIFDPSCDGDYTKAEFAIYRFETSKAELEAEGIYQNLEHIRITDPNQTATGKSNHWSQSGFNFSDEPRQKLEAYEYWGYWDIHGNGTTVPIVAVWVGDTMIRLEESPIPNGVLPFIPVAYLPVDGSIYGEPDSELIEDNQKVIGALTRGMIDTLGRSANSQTGVLKGALDPLNKRKFDKGQDYEFNDPGGAQQAIFQHVYPELPASVYNILQMQNQEAESLTGIRAFSQGISGKGLGETATHAQGALDAAAKRELGILRRFAEGLKHAARIIISMNQSLLSDEEIVRITDEDFIQIRRDDLRGNFDLRVAISTAAADEQKAQELAFMLQTTGQSFGLEMYQMILAEICVLRKMPHLAEQIKNYKPEPNPMNQLEIQEKQLDNELKKAEIAEIQAKIAKLNAEAGLKASEKDLKDLNYLEQEQGVEHAREMERNQAQAQGNMQLEAFKSVLNQKAEKDKPQTKQPQDNPQA